MELKWVKCQGELWCPMGTVNLDHAHFNLMTGVYVIWHAGSTPATVYVNNGFIRDCLRADRLDANIQGFASLGLFVTWASVSPQWQNGVALYLINSLKPKLTRTKPRPPAPAIQVNHPW